MNKNQRTVPTKVIKEEIKTPKTGITSIRDEVINKEKKVIKDCIA